MSHISDYVGKKNFECLKNVELNIELKDPSLTSGVYLLWNKVDINDSRMMIQSFMFPYNSIFHTFLREQSGSGLYGVWIPVRDKSISHIVTTDRWSE